MKPISDNFAAHIDGGMTGIGVVRRGLGQTIKISKWIGRQDNNVAAYATAKGTA
jgi:hypothetical protein